MDLVLPQEKVEKAATVSVAHVNASLAELRRLFLVEDFVDTAKFALLLWVLTYLGSWFNGITLSVISENCFCLLRSHWPPHNLIGYHRSFHYSLDCLIHLAESL